jgi:hypothetical protein
MRAWQLSTIEKLCDKNCKYYVDLVEELTEARAFGLGLSTRARGEYARGP